MALIANFERKEQFMRKSVLLAVLAAATFVSALPSDAATSTAGSSNSISDKFKNGAKAVGHGIMWGPKKVGEGFKKLGSKIKGNK